MKSCGSKGRGVEGKSLLLPRKTIQKSLRDTVLSSSKDIRRNNIRLKKLKGLFGICSNYITIHIRMMSCHDTNTISD